jgi:hypothetical protein
MKKTVIIMAVVILLSLLISAVGCLGNDFVAPIIFIPDNSNRDKDITNEVIVDEEIPEDKIEGDLLNKYDIKWVTISIRTPLDTGIDIWYKDLSEEDKKAFLEASEVMLKIGVKMRMKSLLEDEIQVRKLENMCNLNNTGE